MQTPNQPDPEMEYSYDEVGGFYDHEDNKLHWAITKGRQIHALRLRQDFNSFIHPIWMEVWVGADSPTKEWGNTLANDTARVPVFMKMRDATKYKYLGVFEVQTDDTSEYRCTETAKKVPHDRGISRIVILKRL